MWIKEGKEGYILFNNALNTFYLWLYHIGYMVNDYSDSKRGNISAARWAILSD